MYWGYKVTIWKVQVKLEAERWRGRERISNQSSTPSRDCAGWEISGKSNWGCPGDGAGMTWQDARRREEKAEKEGMSCVRCVGHLSS